jgi:hypothetical protein
MIQTTILSARRVGVVEDFHVWTDQPIEGAIIHPSGSYNKDHYLFKFRFLLNEVSKLDYDYYVFIDADNYFVRHPGEGTFDLLLRDSKVFVQLENDCTSPFVKRDDWWGCPIKFFPLLMRYMGVQSNKIYNTNAGFWIVRREHIREFYHTGMGFWHACREEVGITFTEEAPLAFIGHVMQTDIEQSYFDNTKQVWASDWTGVYSDRLPDGNQWDFEDYMTGEKKPVNPAIVHAMRSKSALIRGI